MTRNIDDLADDRTREIQSAGEKYHDTFLLKRPKTEWPPYIDETAKDLSSDIGIGDLSLSKNDFGQELGTYYRRGLAETAGRYADLPSVLEKQVSDQKLGLLAYQLNELSYDITTNDFGINDVQKAAEAVIEKLLTRKVGNDLNFSFELSDGTVSDIATQLFKNETIASNVDVLLSEFEERASQGLLSLMDEPQMMTPLWDHQRDALEKWCEHDNRGYVDMATATGKTVLGLGALALQYGELHPDDQRNGELMKQRNTSGSDDVLIVAHSELILEQWRREFDHHLNIPQERTTGSDDITLEWGTIRFRTPQALINEDRVEYDLVLLDEAHHYATGSEWGSLLNEFDGDVLAMSGSVDSAESDSRRIKRRLSNSTGPEIKRYTITDARADGVIPSFDWEVHYAPYDVIGNDLQKTAKRSEQFFQDFRKQLNREELSIDTDRRLRTYEDVRRFSHTIEGNALKQQNDEFRDLVTRLFSRRTKQWNLSPVLDAVVDLVVEHSTTEKVVVLADSNAQVEELESRLNDIVSNPSSIYLVSGSQSRTEQHETINEFDEPESAGILLGTGDLLGEGVDMQHASVAINMATGGVNPELVQRIGRVLRNPADTPKHAMFYNVVGVPPAEAAAVPREDGKRIIEQAAGFCSLGGRFNKLPGFATADSLNVDVFETILNEGAVFIDRLDADGKYSWVDDTVESDDLEALHSAVQSGGDTEAILGEWEEYAWEHSKDEPVPSTTDAEKNPSKDETPSPKSPIQSHKGQSGTRENTNGPLNAQDIRRDDTSEAFDGKKSAGEDDQAEHQPDREDLLEELARLYESKRSVPTRSDVINDGEYPLKLYGKLFASLDDAVGKCEAIQDDSEPVNPFIYSTTDQAADEEYEQDPLGKYFESVNAPKSVRSQVEKAAFNGFSQIEQILDLYEAGELATQPNQLASAALEAKVRTQLEKIRDATGEIVKHHVGDEAVEKPNLDTVINQASTDAPRVYESIKQSEGEAAMTLTDEWNVSQQTDSSLKEDSSRSSTGHSVNDRVPANPLAEYYEIFRNFESFLGRLTRSERTSYRTDQDHPMNRWRDEIEKVVYGSGLNGQSPSYGQQQGNRNPIKITEYREAFGNGETVTEYQCMQTVLLDSDVEMLAEKGVIGSEEQIHVPVAPDSGVQLPIAVSSKSELENAINLLQEFPPEPEPAPESQSSSSSVIGCDEQSRGPDQPTEDSRTDNEESTTQEQSGQATDSWSTDTERESVTEQTIFWNRDVERITEYGNEDAETVEANATSNQGTLDKKIDEWKSQLLDLTRRNKLVSFKPTKTKSLPFEETNPTTVADELNGDGKLYIRKRPDEDETHRESASSDNKLPELTADELLPTRIADEAENSLYQIGLKNKQYLRERGVDCLYLSLGMLRWYSVDHSDDANRSPLFLAPVELEEKTLRDKDRHDYVLKPKAEGLRLNPALRKKLAAERGVDLPADTALSLKEIDAAFESVYETLRGFDRWTIQQDIVLGIFDFTKFSLYSDLERNRAAVKSNPIIRALNGDTEPLQEAEGDIETPAAEELDDVVDPVEMYQVLDADSSQQEAIEAAKRGKSFVLQGPPGTGKSQTIANIIAEKLADGERVLFVSEKQAALDVVKNRLDDVGIGRFCLEVHGEKANNADVLANLEDELKASQIESTNNRARRLRKLRERRETINQYGQYLFYSPDGWDLTVYQAFGIVSEHMNAPRVEISIDHPLDVGQETLREAVDRLETLARFENEIDTHETSPWRHTTLTQRDVDMKDSMRRSLNQQLDVLDELIETADELDTNLGVRPQSLSEFRDVSQLLHHLSNRPDIPWQEGFFDESFAQEGSRLEELAELEREREELIDDLTENYQRSFFSANGTELNTELAGYGLLKVFKPSYRSLKREITNHSQEEYDPSYQQVLEDTRKLAEVQHIEDRREDYRGVIQRLGPLYEGEDTDWETLAQAQSWVAELDEFGSSHMSPIIDRLLDGTLPNIESLAEQTQAELNRYSNAATFFESAMVVEEMEVNGQSLRRASLSDLSDALENLRNVVPNLQRRVEFSSQLEKVRGTICEEYVDRFLHSECNGEELVPAFEKRFCTRWLNSVYEHTELGSFSADEMERYIEEFRRLDQEQQELAKIEIQREVTQRRPSLSPEHASSSEQVLIRRETEKQRRHKPLRELFDEAGSFITQVTPCFMMSPLSVAQYLKAGSIQFDAVVFDEASQIMPQDAVSSLIRADQAIIAGDTKQLPPTSFFQSDIETTEDVREDLDSILEETASVLPEKRLRWHYRSRSKELIEFSNYHYYNNSLRTFPENDPDIETGVSFDYVSDGVYDRGGSRRNEVEAQRVIDLIEEHAKDHSEKSLGVVAFSSAQEQAIRDALEERRGESGVLDGFVSQDDVLDEFFIKNLEMVQGDERDRMIFSVGYGPDQAGIVSMNFGPLNKSGGERRLNVTVTRAKEQITVVSSIQPGEIDLTRTNSTGVAHFKNYLEYAQKGDRALARDDSVTSTLDFDSQFEEAVYTALKNEGYDVVSQVQSSSYSIDLAIKHPEQPGKFVLGIECDGAAYHSSKTARDRDRTRQMVLEDLGWTIHRIWSPDWTSNREHEIRKINDKADSLIARRAGSSETDST